ncbi:plasma membrane calcium ATPase [Salpingoeca rosetta]|uniref:Calcium-transporting ATPase n=1 Tax=Salpingoeca rosetta (strain ATCC 50818 / BSB-021) TaxID=946362 RepID=F2UKX2_SALR5|nr:plasma membrane calcium ATPase [Salpingoeca rosetta]EGD77771.1 plasma membrane calcium ATPase [Salpingoeca rosetta]|eukprot:XP_004990247.1 plasma membrane calcium ATPase [Salpingoeca rosetta]
MKSTAETNIDERTDSYRIAIGNPTSIGNVVQESETDLLPQHNGGVMNGVNGNAPEATGASSPTPDDLENGRKESVSKPAFDSETAAAHLKTTMGASGQELSIDDLYALVDPKSPELLQSIGGVDALCQHLKTSMDKGISSDDVVEHNREHFGVNKLPPVQFRSLLHLVWEALQDKTLIMLCIAATISLVIGMVTEGPELGWKDGVAVFVAIIVVVAITSLNDYQKERQFRRLNEIKNDHEVTIIRNGKKLRVSVYEVVVGDLVVVDTGDVVPADGVFVSGESVVADESSATGESEHKKKGHAPNRDPFFLSGTQLTGGSGVMLVICVGEHSFKGRILMSLRTPNEDTPLQVKLSKLANFIGNFGIITALLIFFAQLIKYFAVAGSDVNGTDAANNAVDFLIIAISIVVVAVPEGLPLAVTIALAYSMKNMMRDNNLVRHLDACETMGGATTICSDKTGTLTQNKMTVVEGVLLDTMFDSNEKEELPIDNKTGKSDKMNNDMLRLLYNSIAVNSTAYESINEEGVVTFVGSRTECALLGFLGTLGQDYTKIREATEVEKVYSFSSDKKRMSTVVSSSGTPVSGEGKNIQHVKGAAEVLLEMSTRYVAADGSVKEMTADARKRFEDKLTVMGEKALRSIGMAFRCSDNDQDWTDTDKPELVLLGLVGIQDPLRPEVRDAVRACQSAGVTVRMVTGDAAAIARNIGKNCGLFDESEDHICMEGPDFRNKSEEELIPLLPRLRILARSSPLDKLKLVTLLQKQRDVVAVTGDGVNDGPALKKADVGFAMGLSGTEAAKEASAIVLLDDNFASIVNAIKWGRNVFDNIRKFLQFQLTVNFTAIIVVLVAVLSDPNGNADNSPLKPVQLLWINLIMDSFAALALATEPPTEKLLTYKPYDRSEPLLTTYMIRRMIFQVVMQSATFLTILYAGEDWFNSHKDPAKNEKAQFSVRHYTIIFTSFVLSQLVNQLNCRKLRGELNILAGLTRHWIFCGVWVFSLIIQVLITEFGGTAIETEPLSANQWGACVLIAFLPLAWSTMFNLLPDSITTDPWPWMARVCRRRRHRDRTDSGTAVEVEEGEDEGERGRLVEPHLITPVILEEGEAGKLSDMEMESIEGPRVPLQQPEHVRAGESPSLRDHIGRRISTARAESEEAHPRNRWDMAVWQVLTQLDVVDTMRRHHR